MNKSFEKILERLDEMIHPKQLHFCKCARGRCRLFYNNKNCMDCVVKDAKEIVQEVAEEYNNGWIPISDRFPKNDKYILLSFDNFSMPMIGRYESYESGGAFYIGDEDITCSKQDLFVNAWQPLPECWKGE